MVLEHAALEYIVILGIVGATAVRRLNPNQPAQAIDEALVVRELRTTRIAPLGNELIDVESLPQRLETRHDRTAACCDRRSPQTARVTAAAGSRGSNENHPEDRERK